MTHQSDLEKALREIQLMVLGEGGIPHGIGQDTATVISKMIDNVLTSLTPKPTNIENIIEPSDTDLYTCPESVQNYIKDLHSLLTAPKPTKEDGEAVETLMEDMEMLTHNGKWFMAEVESEEFRKKVTMLIASTRKDAHEKCAVIAERCHPAFPCQPWEDAQRNIALAIRSLIEREGGR